MPTQHTDWKPSYDRPKRLAIPARVKSIVRERQLGVCVCGCGSTGRFEYDHEPALILRDINEDGTDYTPPQLDPDYIDARCKASHRKKTSGSGATTAGTDIGKHKKERRREKRKTKLKRKWPSRPFPKQRKFPNG